MFPDAQKARTVDHPLYAFIIPHAKSTPTKARVRTVSIDNGKNNVIPSFEATVNTRHLLQVSNREALSSQMGPFLRTSVVALINARFQFGQIISHNFSTTTFTLHTHSGLIYITPSELKPVVHPEHQKG